MYNSIKHIRSKTHSTCYWSTTIISWLILHSTTLPPNTIRIGSKRDDILRGLSSPSSFSAWLRSTLERFAVGMAIPPGVIEREMSIMITTLTNMERIHGVIAIGRTENAIAFLVKIIREFFGATVAGSVKVVVLILVYSVAVHNVSCSFRSLWMFDKALFKFFFLCTMQLYI